MEKRLITQDSFHNNRCRIQRLSDAKIFNGWVDFLDAFRCHVRLVSVKSCIEKGDLLQVEIFGQDKKASFTAMESSRSGHIAHMRIASTVVYGPAKEGVRVCVTNVYGKMTADGHRHDVEVVDLSETGLGLVSSVPVKSGTIVQIDIRVSSSSVVFTGEVRYCRKNVPTEGHYRLGILIKDTGRIDRARLLGIISNPESLAG